MALDQMDAELLDAQAPLGEFALPNLEAADVLLQEFEEESENTDELIQIVDASQKVAEQMDMAEDKAITENAAAALGVAIEHFCQRAQIPVRTGIVPLQFACGPAARKVAKKVALEGITDVIKKVTQKIVKFIKKVMNYLYDTMQEMIFGADNILHAAQEIQTRARDIAHVGLKDGGEYISEEKLVHYFSFNNRTYSAGEVLKAYQDYCADMKKSFSEGFVKEIGLRINETLEEAISGESKASTQEKIDTLVKALIDRTFSEFKAENRSDYYELRHMSLPFGGVEFALLLTRDEESKLYNGFNLKQDKSKIKKGAVKEHKLETMRFEQIMGLAKAIENEMLFGMFKSYKNSKSELDKIRRAVEKGCDKIASLQQSSARNATVTYSVNFVKDLITALVSSLALTHRYDIQVARHLLAYCDRSIKAHG